MIKLFEDLKNLNMIDRSFFMDGGRMEKLKQITMTPNSRIEVSKILPHKFTTVMEKLSEDDVAAIVIRAHKRQLLFVTKDARIGKVMNGYYNYNYYVVMSDYAYTNCNSHDYRKTTSYNTEAPAKTQISRTVKDFYDRVAPEGTKKSWDALIIYRDEQVNDLRQKRAEMNKNRVYVPSDGRKYSDFIDNLESAFQERAVKYIDAHRPNIQNAEELKQLMMKVSKLDKIKYKGNIYTYSDSQASLTNRYSSYVRYVANNDDREIVNPQVIYVMLTFKGIMPQIVDVRASEYRYTNYDNSDVISMD